MVPPRTKPELLAPAGEWESLKAAVANGADAVYFGLAKYSARARATNFTPAELPEVMAFLRDRNTKGYVAFNTLVFPEELAEAARYVEAIARAGADAVIVQDAGLLRLIRRLAPSLPVHASTQMTQTHAAGLRVLEDWGASRVILARELSLEQVRAVRAATSLELEVFVHGALCISFSGQCQASGWLFGRSGNRGACAQACRLPYELCLGTDATGAPRNAACGFARQGGAEASARNRTPVREVRYPLSPLDLCALGRVGELIEIGVAGFKIEGRLKSADYVAGVTRAYREAIDAAIAGEPAATRNAATQARLAQGFSRGFTEGFLGGAGHQALVEGRSPKGRGLRVGTVAGVGEGGVLVSILAGMEVRPGDGVVFDSGGAPADEQGGRVYEVVPVRDGSRRGRVVEIAFGQGAVDLAAVAVGAEVWKTDDPRIRRELEHSYSRDVVWRRRGLRVRVTARPGGPLIARAEEEGGTRGVARVAAADPCPIRPRTGCEHPVPPTVPPPAPSAEAQWPGPLEPSQKHPLTVAVLREHLSRLGNTPFDLAGVELVGPDGPAECVNVLAPKSVLNALRRDLVEALRRRRAEAAVHAIAAPAALEVLCYDAANPHDAATLSQQAATLHPIAAGNAPPLMPTVPAQALAFGAVDGESAPVPSLSVLVRSLAQADAAARFHQEDEGHIAILWCDLPTESSQREALATARAANLPVGLATTAVLMPGEENGLWATIQAGPDAVLVRNLAVTRILHEEAPELPLVGDYHLNVANELAASALLGAGLSRVTACLDLDVDRLEAMLGCLPAGCVEVPLRLRVPMFHMAHCLWAANLSASRSCEECARAPAGGEPPGDCLGTSPATTPCRRLPLRLRDRVGEEHRVLADAAGRNTVFASRPRSILPAAARLARAGARWFRVELVDETGEEARRIIEEAAFSMHKLV